MNTNEHASVGSMAVAEVVGQASCLSGEASKSRAPLDRQDARPTTPAELPALHTTLLDAAQVEQLLNDIETCTELAEILPKYAAQGHVPDRAGVTLTEARTLLASQAVRGLQLRYRYDGADWWDTLMLAGDRYRVVRIRHEFYGGMT